MDKVFLQSCSFNTIIGINEDERKEKQELVIDLELFLDVKDAAKNDDLNKTVNYLEVHQIVKHYLESKEHILVETIVEDLAKIIIEKLLVRGKNENQ